MSPKPRHSSHRLNKWARDMVVDNRLRPNEAHLLKEITARVDLDTLSCVASIASIARGCGYHVVESTFTDKVRGEVRTIEKCTAVAAILKRLDELGLIRVAQQGQRRANVYFLNYTPPLEDAPESGIPGCPTASPEPMEDAIEGSLEHAIEGSMEDAIEGSPSPTCRSQSSFSINPPASTPIKLPDQEGAGSTLTRTPETPLSRTPDDEPDMSPEEIRALIASSPLGKRVNGINEEAA